MSVRLPSRRPRRHGVRLEPQDRRTLERDGWRTTLDYRENHLRGRGGQLLEVLPTWTAVAERFEGDCEVATASAPTVDEAWTLLRQEVEARTHGTHAPVWLHRA